MKELTAILKARAAYGGERMALATIVKTVGSSYRRAGARMLICESGTVVGSISGGCLEQDVIEHARRVCHSGETVLLSYDTTLEEDALFGVGLGCKGVIEILVEPMDGSAAAMLDSIAAAFERGECLTLRTIFRSSRSGRVGQRVMEPHEDEEVFEETVHPPVELYIFGAGFDAIPLARMAKDLGFAVRVIDRRPAYVRRERFPDVDDIALIEPPAVLELCIRDRAAAVVMAHHYITDRDYLRALIKKPLRYLGLMGPRRRAEKMLQEFRDEGLLVGDECLQKLHNPVGLDIGAEGPEQIALAILAEINAVFAGHGGGMLREKKGPIHSPRSEAS